MCSALYGSFFHALKVLGMTRICQTECCLENAFRGSASMGCCRQLCKFQYFKEIQSIIFAELEIDYMLGSYPNIYQPMQA